MFFVLPGLSKQDFLLQPDGSFPGWANTSLGAQDNVFADHLLAANSRFALIEFKASFLAIRTEAKKPLRQKLFHLLAMRSDFLRRCLDFHFVCWGTTHRHPDWQRGNHGLPGNPRRGGLGGTVRYQSSGALRPREFAMACAQGSCKGGSSVIGRPSPIGYPLERCAIHAGLRQVVGLWAVEDGQCIVCCPP